MIASYYDGFRPTRQPRRRGTKKGFPFGKALFLFLQAVHGELDALIDQFVSADVYVSRLLVDLF